jgi:hypothetical protein
VVKGFLQKEGIDVFETFAATSSKPTLRAVLAQVAAENRELHQLDVKTAFLNAELEEEIYVQQPPGFEAGGSKMVCKLHKALYGLRQAPRAWAAKLKEELEGVGFQAGEADPGLFLLSRKIGDIFLLVYVDDILISAPEGDAAGIAFVKKALKRVFDIHDLGEAKVFLGMEIVRDRERRSLKLHQASYARRIVERFGQKDAKSRVLPMDKGERLTAGGNGKLLDKERYPYSAAVGSLLYLSACTRPDIAFVTGALARYMQNPTEEHWGHVINVYRYIGGTLEQGLVFGEGDESSGGGEQLPLVPDVYGDADYASDPVSRRSTTGYVIRLYGAAVSWKAQQQPTVAFSTMDAECQAAGAVVRECLWVRKLMRDLGIAVQGPLKVWCDNQAAIIQLDNPISSSQSKHFDVLHHATRERVARREVSFAYCPSAKMVADALTKAVPAPIFKFCKEGLGVK